MGLFELILILLLVMYLVGGIAFPAAGSLVNILLIVLLLLIILKLVGRI
jgi:hypothetical protein